MQSAYPFPLKYGPVAKDVEILSAHSLEFQRHLSSPCIDFAPKLTFAQGYGELNGCSGIN